MQDRANPYARERAIVICRQNTLRRLSERGGHCGR
jgi:hypothetical protein